MEQTACVRGQCNCRSVRFALDVPITDVYICHCSLCRRATGVIGVAVAVVPSAKFRWEAGEDSVRHWRMPGHDWECCFCSQCGSHLPGRNSPETIYIPVGTLDEGADRLEVKHHIWVSSKAAWDQIGDDGQQHPRGIDT